MPTNLTHASRVARTAERIAEYIGDELDELADDDLDVAAINGRNSQETRMGLDLSQAGRVDRAAKGIASDAIRAIGLIAQIDADEAADVCRGVTHLIERFRCDVIAAARRAEYPPDFDPFTNMRVVASVPATAGVMG